jgi:hypothetical protein
VLYPLSYEGIVPICRGFSSATAGPEYQSCEKVAKSGGNVRRGGGKRRPRACSAKALEGSISSDVGVVTDVASVSRTGALVGDVVEHRHQEFGELPPLVGVEGGEQFVLGVTLRLRSLDELGRLDDQATPPPWDSSDRVVRWQLGSARSRRRGR